MASLVSFLCFFFMLGLIQLFGVGALYSEGADFHVSTHRSCRHVLSKYEKSKSPIFYVQQPESEGIKTVWVSPIQSKMAYKNLSQELWKEFRGSNGQVPTVLRIPIDDLDVQKVLGDEIAKRLQSRNFTSKAAFSRPTPSRVDPTNFAISFEDTGSSRELIEAFFADEQEAYGRGKTDNNFIYDLLQIFKNQTDLGLALRISEYWRLSLDVTVEPHPHLPMAFQIRLEARLSRIG